GKAVALRPMRHLDAAEPAVQRDAAAIDAVLDPLDALDGARPEMAEHRRPIVRRPVIEAKRQPRRFARHRGLAPERAGRPAIERLEGLVEAPEAAEPGGE